MQGRGRGGCSAVSPVAGPRHKRGGPTVPSGAAAVRVVRRRGGGGAAVRVRRVRVRVRVWARRVALREHLRDDLVALRAG